MGEMVREYVRSSLIPRLDQPMVFIQELRRITGPNTNKDLVISVEFKVLSSFVPELT